MELPDEVVAESIPFRLLQGHVQHLTSECDAKKLELDRATKEADGLREMQESFRELVFVRPSLRARCAVRLTRVRANRGRRRSRSTRSRRGCCSRSPT